jgi:hypothetical protein
VERRSEGHSVSYRAKRENEGLGEDPSGNTITGVVQVAGCCKITDLRHIFCKVVSQVCVR